MRTIHRASRSSGVTVLAIRLRRLGDVITTLGTLRAIKRADPEGVIIYVVDRGYHELLADVSYVDDLLPEPPRWSTFGASLSYAGYVDGLRRREIDCVLDFHSNLRSAILTYVSGAPVRVGFNVRGRKSFYNRTAPRSLVENGRRVAMTSHESALMLAARAGLPAIDEGVERTISVRAEHVRGGKVGLVDRGVPRDHIESGRVVALNAGDPYPAKAWQDEAFVVVAQRLIARDVSVVVLWGPGERERAERIARGAGRGAVVGAPSSLVEVAGALTNVAALVTIDSGLKHLAVAVGTPTVTLFGPTNPQEWHMGGDRDRYVWARLSCSPCRLTHCPFATPCMGRLSPNWVLATLARAAPALGLDPARPDEGDMARFSQGGLTTGGRS